MALNLHLLRLFMTVAEHGNLSRAAQSAHISQPAVTRGIQELEKQVGLPLLERGARGVRLTEAGNALQQHARAIFAAEQAAEDELLSYRGLSGGTLRIGASLTIANYYLPEHVSRFHTLHPRLVLHLTSGNTETIERLLLDYELDVALVEGPVHHQRIAVRRWRDDDLVVIAAFDHPLGRRKRLKTTDLDEADWVVREPGSGTREVVEEILQQRHIDWQHTLEMNSAEAIKQTVAAGRGLSIVSLHSVADQLAAKKLRVLPLTDFSIKRSFSYITLANRPLGVASRAFEKFIFDAVARR